MLARIYYPPPLATRAEVHRWMTARSAELRARHESDEKRYSVRVGNPTAKRKPLRLTWWNVVRLARDIRRDGSYARVVYIRPKLSLSPETR